MLKPLCNTKYMLKIIKAGMKMNLKRNIANLFLIICICVLYYLLSPQVTKSVVFIPKGSVSEIISYLNKNGFKMSFIDKYFLIFLGSPQSGWINMGTKPLNRAEFLHKLTTGKAAVKTLTLIPGESTPMFARLLAKNLLLDEDKLLAQFYKLSAHKEGMLYPESYKLPLGIKEKELAKLLLRFAQNKFEEISYKIFGEYDQKKFYEYIIIASIIQKEAANNAEMPTVASVIYNRLKKHMRLQMDGTLNYGYFSHTKVTAQRIRQDNSFYNTYKHSGLPPRAVCNVSFAAIKAAIFPKKTDFLYFVRDRATGVHIFTTNLNAHNAAISK